MIKTRGMDAVRPSPLIRTKLRAPRLTSRVVARSRLFERLAEGLELPLTLVSAPAGYGKSTLVASWLSESERPFAWVSLDEGDSTLVVFLSYLLAAVGTVVQGACPESRAILRVADLPPARAMAGLLANELDGLDQDLTLALDDYHLIHDPAVHDLLTQLLRHPPRPLHLVILSRRDPPLPLASLRSGGRMVEIRARDLEFTAAEASEFFTAALGHPIAAETLERLRTTTEGWAVGLQLAALSLRGRSDVEPLLEKLKGGGMWAGSELVGEVLSRQPPEFQASLLTLSILDRFCASLCEAVCAASGDIPGGSGAAFLAGLEQSDLFINALDDRHKWYRFHHLFRDLLRRELETRLSTDQVTELRRRAAVWLEANGYHDEALSHYVGSGDLTAALDLVKRHRHDMMNREQWDRLDRWLRLLPPRAVRADLELEIQRAWICENRYRYREVLDILGEIDELLADQREVVPNDVVRGEIEALRSVRFYFAGDARRAVACADRALEAIPAGYPSQRGFALVIHAFANQMLGEYEHAVSGSLEALHDRGIRGTTLHARILIGLCFIHWMEANIEQVRRVASELLSVGEEFGLPESISFARYFLGVSHYDRDELEQAELALRPEVTQPVHPNTTNHSYSSIVVALIHQTRGAAERASELAAAVAARGLEVHNPALVSLAEAFEAELALRQGRLREALAWARTFEPTGEGTWWRFFLPELTYARICIAEGTTGALERAESFLGRLFDRLSAIHNRRFQVDVLTLQALLRSRQGDEEAALSTLGHAIELAEPRELARPFLDLGPEIQDLLGRLGADSKERPFLAAIMDRLPPARLAAAVSPPVELASRPELDALTERELDVLGLLAERLSNKEIGDRLFISPATVKRHTVNIYQKLQVSRRREAVDKARSLGILPAR